MGLPIPVAALQQHIITLGKTRSGKSSALRVLIEHLFSEGEPVIILDPKGDWWGLKSSQDGKRAGFPVVIFGGEHADIPLSAGVGSGQQVAELLATGNRPAIIDLGGWSVGDRTRFFVDFAAALFRTSKGKRWLAIDEVHNFVPQGRVLDPLSGQMVHWGNRLASEGLGKGIQLMAASQRPQKVHKDFVTSCETLIAMRAIHPLDRAQVKDWIDGCPDAEKGKQVLAELANMPRGTAWVWSPEIGFGPKKIAFPMFSTFDSFKPRVGEHTAKLKGWAEVDLDEVKEKLAVVVEEAERNDPAKLRAKIRELEGMRGIKQDVDKALNRNELNAEYTRGREEGFEAGRVKGREEMWNVLHPALDRIDDAQSALIGAAEAFNHKLGKIELRLAPERPPVPQTYPKRSTPDIQIRVSVGLRPARQKILDQILWLRAKGISPAPKETLAAVCGVSSSSGSYANNLGALRSAGYIDYPSPGTADLTAAGAKIAVAPEDNGRSVYENWLAIVPPAQRKILERLFAAHPKAMEKDKLAEDLGVSDTSGSYANNLGRLRTIGAVDYPKPGHVALTKHVIPD